MSSPSGEMPTELKGRGVVSASSSFLLAASRTLTNPEAGLDEPPALAMRLPSAETATEMVSPLAPEIAVGVWLKRIAGGIAFFAGAGDLSLAGSSCWPARTPAANTIAHHASGC